MKFINITLIITLCFFNILLGSKLESLLTELENKLNQLNAVLATGQSTIHEEGMRYKKGTFSIDELLNPVSVLERVSSSSLPIFLTKKLNYFQKLNQEISKDLNKYKDLRTLTPNVDDNLFVIFYLPQRLKEAYILKGALESQNYTPYLEGYLLGFSDEQIKQQYHKFFPDSVKMLNQHKRKALEFIEYEETRLSTMLKNLTESYERMKAKEIIKFSQPSKFSCGAQIKAGGINLIRSTDNEFECLINGYKNLLFLDSGHSGKAIKIQRDYPEKNIQIIRLNDSILIFTPEGKKNALLFEKAQNSGHLDMYLTGYLLGYDKEDIEFFFQRLNRPESYKMEKDVAEKFLQENENILNQ